MPILQVLWVALHEVVILCEVPPAKSLAENGQAYRARNLAKLHELGQHFELILLRVLVVIGQSNIRQPGNDHTSLGFQN